MHTLVMAEGWQGLSTVRFSAEVGGVQTGVGLGGVGGEVVGGC